MSKERYVHTIMNYDRIFELIDEKSEAICGLYGCRFKRDKTMNGLPVLMNDRLLTEQFVGRAGYLFGTGTCPSDGTFDFGRRFRYLSAIDTRCDVGVGGVSADTGCDASLA